MTGTRTVKIYLPEPHPQQRAFIDSPAPRKIVKAGRQSGKTTGVAVLAGEAFLDGLRVLYAAPTEDQIDRFWAEIKWGFEEAVSGGVFYRNEVRHLIEAPRKVVNGVVYEPRIRAKTAFNADTLRGDNADLLILDEYQLMSEDAWERVGQPMLLVRNGKAVFVYTPPSLQSRTRTRARDPKHASKLYDAAQEDTTGTWQTFHFTSHDNPYVSREGLERIAEGMTSVAYRQEIMAEDVEDVPGAMFKSRTMIDPFRSLRPVSAVTREVSRLIVAVDPSGTKTGDEAGIIVLGSEGDEAFVLADYSDQLSPNEWGTLCCDLYKRYQADYVLAEFNFGADMVETIINQIDSSVPVKTIKAHRGKKLRAQPVVALYERGKVHHVGSLLGLLEKEMTEWVPGETNWSPGRLDALVHGVTDLLVKVEEDDEDSYGSALMEMVT